MAPGATAGFRAVAALAFTVLNTTASREAISASLEAAFSQPGVIELPEYQAAVKRFAECGELITVDESEVTPIKTADDIGTSK